MTPKQYIRQILKAGKFDPAIRARVAADLESDISARLETGETMDDVAAAMGTPQEVAASLRKSMELSPPRRGVLRWVLLVAAVILGVLFLVSIWMPNDILRLFEYIRQSSQPMVTQQAIGIIGGADGPTAIFTTAAISTLPISLFILFASLVCGFLLAEWQGDTQRNRFLAIAILMLVLAGLGGLNTIASILQLPLQGFTESAGSASFIGPLLFNLLAAALSLLFSLVAGIKALRQYMRTPTHKKS